MFGFKHLRSGVKIAYLLLPVYLNVRFCLTIRGLYDPNQLTEMITIKPPANHLLQYSSAWIVMISAAVLLDNLQH